MTTIKVLVAKRALKDIQSIHAYSEKIWGNKTCLEYMQDLNHAVNLIRQHPDILEIDPEISEELYFYRVNRHFLICSKSDQSICILAVIHCAMDLPQKLNKLEPRLKQEAKILNLELNRKLKS